MGFIAAGAATLPHRKALLGEGYDRDSIYFRALHDAVEVLRGLLPEKDAKSMLPDVSDTFCSFFEKGDFDKLKWQKIYTQSFEKGLYTDWRT